MTSASRTSTAQPTPLVAAVPSSGSSPIDDLVANATKALEAYARFTQDEVDHLVKKAAVAALDKHGALAELAVTETGRGVFEDKAVKNIFACEHVTHGMATTKTVGVISRDDITGITEIAEPVGVICGVTPVTNPTSTAIFKSLIALKTRNPIIFAFHPSAQESSVAAARVVRDAAVAAGAPEHCIQWVEAPSIAATNELMNHPGVALILATGGNAMVRAAYSCGKPALGVGAGNVPAYIEKSAKLKRAVKLPYFDYSTVELRREMCEREFAINHAISPELYSGICPIVREGCDLRFGSPGDSNIVDWVVVMRRFALALGLVDRPDQRKQHLGEVPLVGGLAIFTGMLAGAVCYGVFDGFERSLLGTAAVLALLGALDDRFGLSVRPSRRHRRCIGALRNAANQQVSAWNIDVWANPASKSPNSRSARGSRSASRWAKTPPYRSWALPMTRASISSTMPKAMSRATPKR